MGINNSHLACEDCYFSEMIDGTLFCNYDEKDVALDDYCYNFVNVFRLKDIFKDVEHYLELNYVGDE